MNASKTPIFLAVIVLLSGSIWLAPDHSDPAEPYAYGLRVTARIVCVFLMLTCMGRELVQVPVSGQWLVRYRRFLGLVAALAHTVHLACIVLCFRLTGKSVEPVPVIFVGPGLRVFAWFRLDSAVRPTGV